MDSELVILERVRAGDHRAFGLIIDRHKDAAFTLAVRILGSREEAEETVQDAFLRAYQALGTFRGESRFGTWLYRIVFNLSMTRVNRRRRPHETIESMDDDMHAQALDDGTPDILERMEEEEIANRLARSMRGLPERHRIALELFYLQEQSYEEIATIMAVPVGTVKTYLFRGRARLKVLLVRDDDGNVRAA